MSFRLKVKACAEQPNPLSIVAAVILRINKNPNAWGDGNVVVDLKAIEGFNVIGIPNTMRILSDLEVIQHNFAKVHADKGAYIIKVKIGDTWHDKCFVRRCPRCNKKIPRGLAAGGIEYCRAPNCHYKRRLFTPEEWQIVFNR